MVITENYNVDPDTGIGTFTKVKPRKVAHGLKDDTTNRSRQRHLKEVQQMKDAAIKFRIKKGE